MTHTPEVRKIVGDCWVWPGALDSEGYARLQTKTGWARVQRIIWSAVNGTIPDGLVIDHLCRNRSCFKPAHLEAVSNKVNVLRGNGHTALNARKTHCKHGHPFVDGNIAKTLDGGRDCLTCRRLITKRYEQRRRVQGWRQRRVDGKLTWIAP